MVYLIIGGTGFIGCYVTRLLLSLGRRVVLYDLHPDEAALDDALGDQSPDNLAVLSGDVREKAKIAALIKQYGVSVIIHLASLLTDASNEDPPLAIEVNCLGTAQIFELAHRFGIRRIVWASSIAVFGLPERYGVDWIPNDAPHFPISFYGHCKSFNEGMATHYFNHCGVDSIGLRFTYVYGLGRVRGAGYAQELVENPLRGKPAHVSFGDDAVDWLYVEDAARAIVLACDAEPTRTRVFTVGGEVKPICEVAEHLRQLIPSAAITLEPGASGIAWRFDTSAAQRELGFVPEFTVERAIADMKRRLFP
ncbi:MAG: NAD(P)-dependent oxidoreductase [Acidobacteria bacterium]|nr:NAD(P)-dependent oxidoreductase [Acidobacteriota bacterium]